MPKFILGLILLSTAGFGITESWVKQNRSELTKLYRDFHLNPELSYQEVKTAKKVAQQFKAAGYKVTTGIGGHGVVALLENGAGPTVMLRTDMDALPVTEATGLSYASKVKVKKKDGSITGVMHACGHDVHMTNLIGTAKFLSENRGLWSGTLVLIGQPAEEVGGGAIAMLEDGLFSKFPKPDFAIALHASPELPTGQISYRPGYAMANVDSVDIEITGKGGHGSKPESTIDPIVIASRLVMDLQTIVSREIKPIEPAVVTVGSIHAGTKHNIIGKTAHLQITVRSYKDGVRKKLIRAIRRKAEAAALSSGAPKPVVTLSEGTPALFNNEKLTAHVAQAFKKKFGAKNVMEIEPIMGGEDFSQYGRAGIPVFMYFLGSIDKKRYLKLRRTGKLPSMHSPLYYPDIEGTLETGIESMAQAVTTLMPPKVLGR